MSQETPYEKRLNRNYSLVGESSAAMIQRKVEVLRNIFEDFSLPDQAIVLDIGCGVGLFEQHLSSDPHISRIVGIDADLLSLEEARKHTSGKCSFLHADGKDIPFADGTFDLAFMSTTLHHIQPEERSSVMREIRRVTKPGGMIVIFEHNPYNPLTRFFVKICPLDKGVKLLTPSHLKRLARDTGLKILAIRFLIFFPTFLKFLCRKEHLFRSIPIGAQYMAVLRNSDNLDKNQQIEREFHDKLAAETSVQAIRPHLYFETYSAFENRYAMEALGHLRGMRILDLGCGNGEAAVYFALCGAKVSAVDISPLCIQNSLALAARFGVTLDLHVMAAENLGFEASMFDGVFGLGVLHHFSDLNQSLKEIRRVLKEGGRAAFIEPLSHNPFIKIYRFLAKEVRTPTERPLNWEQLMSFGEGFSSLIHKEFWFFSLLIFVKFFLIDHVHPSKVRYWKKILEESSRYEMILKKLRAWDERFLQKFPYFKRHCWNSVLVLTK